MNLPPQVQQDIEKWASNQGVSIEQFVLQAVTEKIGALAQDATGKKTTSTFETTAHVPAEQTKVYEKEGILVIDAELPEQFDIGTFINELREERIQEQLSL
jgi:hypothetical protein